MTSIETIEAGKIAFAVVHFTDTEEVEVVPTSWIISESRVYWPPFASPSAMNKAIKQRLEPADAWDQHSIRIMCACETYEEARQKSIKAQYTSDLDVANNKRQSKRPARLDDSYEESDADEFAPRIMKKSDQSARTRFETEVLRTLPKLEVAVANIISEQAKLPSMLTKLVNNSNSAAEASKLELHFPCDSVEQMEDVDRKLADNTVRQLLINELSSIGGHTMTSNIDRIMRHIMSHDLSKRYNWIGKTGWKCADDQANKLPFKDMKLSSVIVDSVLKNCRFNATRADVEGVVKKWLRGSGDRAGGRKERRQRAAESFN